MTLSAPRFAVSSSRGAFSLWVSSAFCHDARTALLAARWYAFAYGRSLLWALKPDRAVLVAREEADLHGGAVADVGRMCAARDVERHRIEGRIP